MKFSDVREILYNSDEISWMDDSLEESVPFVCRINDVPMDGFLYWDQQGDQLEVKKMIAISREDRSLVSLDTDGIKQQFGIDRMTYNSPVIDNYDEYLDKIDEYVEIYERLFEDKSECEKYGEREYGLLGDIMGSDIMKNLILIVAKEFVKWLFGSVLNKKNNNDPNIQNEENDDVSGIKMLENS